LSYTRNDACQQEGPWIDFAPQEELKFLSRGQWKCIPDTCGVEGRHHTRDALVFLLLQLLFGLFVRAFFGVSLWSNRLRTGIIPRSCLRIAVPRRGRCESRLLSRRLSKRDFFILCAGRVRKRI